MILLGVGLALTARSATAGQAGVASAVVPQSLGTPPAEDTRVLQVGVDMFTDERVQTGPRGKTQLLFLDGSALSVGPNSDLVLDTFVYDSETKTGTLALSTTKGLFRFVGGRISKKSPVTLRTPTATIGIRGGIITARVSATLTRSTFHFGDEMTVSAGGVTKSTSRPGNAITATPEAPPSDPQPASGDQLAEDLGGLEKAGGDPDTEVAVGDDDVAASQIAELGSQGEPEVLGGGGGSESEGATASDDAGGQDAEAEGKANEQDAANVLCSQQANAASCGNGDRDDIVSTASGSSSSSIANATNTTSGFAGGRGKRGTDITVGTADTTAGQNFALTDAALSGNLFTATTSAGNYRLHVPDSSGNFTLGDDATARPAETPFGATTGNGFLSPNRDFVFFKLNGSRQFVFGGVQTPASAFPATGGTNFAMVSDFALGDSRLAFLPANTGGTLTSTETNAFIYWNQNGDSTNIRPLFAQTVVINGNGTSQNSAFTMLTGAVFTGDSDRILIRGTQVGGSRIDGTQRVFNGFVASASNGISGGIFGTASPDYFVLEAARLNDAGTPISGGEGVAVATAGSTAGATIFPNAAFGTQEVSSESAIARSTHLASGDNQLKGFASGIVQSFDSSGNFVQASKLLNNTVSSTNPQEVVQVEYNAATSLVQATFDLKNGLGSGPFSTIAPKFGSFGLTNGTNAYVSDELFGARGQSSNSRIDGIGAGRQRSRLLPRHQRQDQAGEFALPLECQPVHLRLRQVGLLGRGVPGNQRRAALYPPRHLGRFAGTELFAGSDQRQRHLYRLHPRLRATQCQYLGRLQLHRRGQRLRDDQFQQLDLQRERDDHRPRWRFVLDHRHGRGRGLRVHRDNRRRDRSDRRRRQLFGHLQRHVRRQRHAARGPDRPGRHCQRQFARRLAVQRDCHNAAVMLAWPGDHDRRSCRIPLGLEPRL